MSGSCPVSARVCQETARERDEARAAFERLRAGIEAPAGFEWETTNRTVPKVVPCDCTHPQHARLVGDDSPPTHVSFDLVPHRRLVGPWEPAEEITQPKEQKP